MVRGIVAVCLIVTGMLTAAILLPRDAKCAGQPCALSGQYVLTFESAEFNGLPMTAPSQLTESTNIAKFTGDVWFYTDLVEPDEYRHLDVYLRIGDGSQPGDSAITLTGDKTCCAGDTE